MPSEEEIQKIKNYTSKGRSINQIKNILGLPKSTVYYHFRKEVGQKQKRNQLQIPESEEVRGEICGVFAGDGNHFYDEKKYEHRIKITLNAKEDYWKILAKFLEKQLGKPPHIHHYNSRTIIDYSSKALYQLLDSNLYWETGNKTETIRPKRAKSSKEFKIGFLRGLIDTDGYMAPDHRRYSVTSISKDMILASARFLTSLGIDNKIREYTDERENHRKIYFLQIFGNSAIKLNEKVEPRNPKRKCTLDRL